jgi:hypothetical protein
VCRNGEFIVILRTASSFCERHTECACYFYLLAFESSVALRNSLRESSSFGASCTATRKCRRASVDLPCPSKMRPAFVCAP